MHSANTLTQIRFFFLSYSSDQTPTWLLCLNHSLDKMCSTDDDQFHQHGCRKEVILLFNPFVFLSFHTGSRDRAGPRDVCPDGWGSAAILTQGWGLSPDEKTRITHQDSHMVWVLIHKFELQQKPNSSSDEVKRAEIRYPLVLNVSQREEEHLLYHR